MQRMGCLQGSLPPLETSDKSKRVLSDEPKPEFPSGGSKEIDSDTEAKQQPATEGAPLHFRDLDSWEQARAVLRAAVAAGSQPEADVNAVIDSMKADAGDRAFQKDDVKDFLERLGWDTSSCSTTSEPRVAPLYE